MLQPAYFRGQAPDEKILIFKRRHWYVLLTRLIWPVFLLMVGLLISLLLSLALRLNEMFTVLLAVLFTVPPFLWLIWRFLDWENDWYIVTNRRVLLIDRVYFIREERFEARLDRIQDVTIRKPTLIHNLLDFGDLTIETAGSAGGIRFESIGHPRHIQNEIFRIMAAAQHHDERGEGLDYVPPPPSAGRAVVQSEKPAYQVLWESFVALFFVPIATLGRNPRIYRKHWIVLLGSEIGPVLAMVLWMLGLIVRIALVRSMPVLQTAETWIWITYALLIPLILAWAAWRYIDWWNDLYVLSENRIIDIEKTPLQKEERREANFGVIQDVRYAKPNPVAQLLDFGHVIVETAGETGAFTFNWVPQPRQVQNEVFERVQQFRERRVQEQREQRLSEVRQALRELMAEQQSNHQ